MTEVLSVFTRTVFAFLIERARDFGADRKPQCGAVTFIQRFGSALGKFAESLLFKLNAHDPIVLSVSIVMMVLVSLGAGFVPAHRASRVDPIRVLRYE